MTMLQMAIRIPQEDAAELDAEAIESRTTRSELVRLAVAEHLMRRRRLTDPWSALAAEGKLIPATRTLDLTSPLPVLSGPSLSQLLADDRDGQRY
jgi:Ribbon-helix-helix protein, copG family